MRKRPTGEAGACPASDPRNPSLEARAHHVLHLSGRAREDDRAWRHSVLEEAVGLVRPELVGVRGDVLVACDLLQPPDQQIDVHPRPF